MSDRGDLSWGRMVGDGPEWTLDPTAANGRIEPSLSDAAKRSNRGLRKKHKICGRLDADDRHPIQPHSEKP